MLIFIIIFLYNILCTTDWCISSPLFPRLRMSFSSAALHWERLNVHLQLFPAGCLFKVHLVLSIRRDVQRGPSGGIQSLVANWYQYRAQPALPFPGNHENVEITLHTPNIDFRTLAMVCYPQNLCSLEVSAAFALWFLQAISSCHKPKSELLSFSSFKIR